MTETNHDPIRNVVIVGGGSAGWITAGLIASEFPGTDASPVRVTLVESPDVKTIGVGEGTWPTMRATLQKIGLSETAFLRECSAAFKQGTKFVGWATGGSDDVYYHPFSAPEGYARIDLAPHWQAHSERVSYCDAVSVQGYLCDRNRAPKQESTPEYAQVVNYAYHLDAGKFADLLKRHCTSELGVTHILDHVTGINGSPDEDIRSIRTAGNGDIEGDLFVDCTGFKALLLGEHYQVPYIDRSDILFNDRALAVQVPYANDSVPIASQTISTARAAGWIWDIGLTTRRGIGYTYSSRHTTDDAAAEVLRSYIEETGGAPNDTAAPRQIRFRPGHRSKFWHRNCVAVGMAAGFLEPLEASALVLVELAGRMLSEELPANRKVMDIVADRYNEKFLYRWDRIIDFLKLHYVLSSRSDANYWIENRQRTSIPDSLSRLLELWRFHLPGRQDLAQLDEVFSIASYQYVLYGMGFRAASRSHSRHAKETALAGQLFSENSEKARRLLATLPDHRELLARIQVQGLPRENAA